METPELCPRPETRPAGRAGDKGDSGCRRMDRPSPRHLVDVDSRTNLQESPCNELARRPEILPVADSAAADEDASVES
ncbi:hypothetical protein SprV_0702278200 [Sparganum proliferum]